MVEDPLSFNMNLSSIMSVHNYKIWLWIYNYGYMHNCRELRVSLIELWISTNKAIRAIIDIHNNACTIMDIHNQNVHN